MAWKTLLSLFSFQHVRTKETYSFNQELRNPSHLLHKLYTFHSQSKTKINSIAQIQCFVDHKKEYSLFLFQNKHFSVTPARLGLCSYASSQDFTSLPLSNLVFLEMQNTVYWEMPFRFVETVILYDGQSKCTLFKTPLWFKIEALALKQRLCIDQVI